MSDHVADSPVDTRDMNTVHTFFRREFRLVGGVIRAVPDGDAARAGVVADHLDYIGRSLHHHHTAEDELAWPLLLERVPHELAPIVELMESQHERVDGLLGEIAEVTPAWRASASAVDRDRLADLTDTLYAHVAEHLDAEEERLLPIAARTLTEEEWRAIGLRAKNSSPRADLTLTFGMFQYEGDPAVLARMLADAPSPVRWLVPRLARRAFRRRALQIHGTVTP
jgi:hemerythrin-like domain-containing protein